MKYIALFIVIILLTACSEEGKKQFEFAGGKLSFAIDYAPGTFIPAEISDYYSAVVLSQTMEGLVSLDPKDLKVRPQLASEWSVSDDGLRYDFVLREDVYFHPHPLFGSRKSRKFSAEDVVKSIEFACTKNAKGNAPHAYTFLYKNLLVGADDFFAGNAKSIKGVVVNKNKISLLLLHRDDNFLNKLSNICASVNSSKLIKNNSLTDLIGTGPFVYKGTVSGEQPFISFQKNEDYYLQDAEGNALPYLDTLSIYIQNRKLEQLSMFEEHQLDMITELPTSRITKILEGRIRDFNSKPPLLVMYNNPLLATNYYFFNMKDPRFKNKKVRQAFNYAVDREKIGREILRNQYANLGYYGIVPPISKIFPGYNFEEVHAAGYTYDPERAKKLLAEAGYPNGKGFGSVDLRFNIGDLNSAVADEFAQQIFQNLNINVNIDGSTFEQKDADASMGRGAIFRSAWSADYPSPETFLVNFYGKLVPADLSEPSRINQSRYNNIVFDQLFEQAKNSSKKVDAIRYYAKAELILMQDPPIIPLWYSGDIQIIYSDVRNFYFNALNLFVFREVYKKKWSHDEYQKTLQ